MTNDYKDFTEVGLGLDYGNVRLDRTSEACVAAGQHLRDETASALGTLVRDVELIGSSSVVGLLAKPILDLAVGVDAFAALDEIRDRLVADGWIYRGDAGSDGGHVFVLEARPWHRVAHLHVVSRGAPEWRAYLMLRDLLRCDAGARLRYEAEKLRLADEHRSDHRAYTAGKTDVASALLDSAS